MMDLSVPDNFPIKREQTKARFQYAEHEEVNEVKREAA